MSPLQDVTFRRIRTGLGKRRPVTSDGTRKTGETAGPGPYQGPVCATGRRVWPGRAAAQPELGSLRAFGLVSFPASGPGTPPAACSSLLGGPVGPLARC